MLNKILLLCFAICISSCGILRQKEKTKVVVKIDSIHQQSAVETKIDTGNFKSYKKTTYYALPMEFPPQNYPSSLINSTNALANSTTGLKNSTSNVFKNLKVGFSR